MHPNNRTCLAIKSEPQSFFAPVQTDDGNDAADVRGGEASGSSGTIYALLGELLKRNSTNPRILRPVALLPGIQARNRLVAANLAKIAWSPTSAQPGLHATQLSPAVLLRSRA